MRTISLRFIPILLVFIFFASSCSAQVRNLTESNKAVLSEKIEMLQQTELVRVTRGRMKSNPVPFQLHSIYQAVLQGQDMMMTQFTLSYAGALMRLDKVFSDYKVEVSTPGGTEIRKYFRTELIRIYDLNLSLKDLESIYSVYEELNASRVALDALPQRAALALNAYRWSSRIKEPDSFSTEELAQLNTLMRSWKRSTDVFMMEESLKSLSKDYSDLFGKASERVLNTQ